MTKAFVHSLQWSNFSKIAANDSSFFEKLDRLVHWTMCETSFVKIDIGGNGDESGKRHLV